MASERDLRRYELDYRNLPFERVVESFRKRAIVDLLNSMQYRHIVEVGCGERSIFHELDGRFYGLIIEPIKKFLDNQSFDEGRQIAKLCARIEDVAQSSVEPPEVIILSSLLHEVSEPADVIRKVHRLLRPGGVVVCVVPNALSLHRLLGVHKGIIKEVTDHSETQLLMQQRQKPFTPDSFQEFLQQTGFRVEILRTFFPKPTSHQKMQSLLDDGLVSTEFLNTLYNLSEQLDPLGSEILALGHRL
jgi:trans-aconitate methyltransferase